MSHSQLFLRLLLRAAWVRKDRALTALLSVAVVATIATAALTIYSDLEGKLSHEFRGFGANVIVSSPAPLDASSMEAIRNTVGQQSQAVPVAYAVASTRDKAPVVIGGTDIKAFRDLNSSWAVRSTGNQGTGVLLGSRAAESLSPKGGPFDLSYGDHALLVEPEIVFNSGSDDDSRIY